MNDKKRMKVLFVSYAHVGVGKGGMLLQILQTANALRAMNIDVEFHRFDLDCINEFDLVHFFGLSSLNSALLDACRAHNIPYFVSPVFNYFGRSFFRESLDKLILSLFPRFRPNLRASKVGLLGANAVVALNTMERNKLVEFFNVKPTKIRIIPNGIDRERFLSEELIDKISKVKNRVLCVGEICERKNQLSLIRASINQNWELFLVGPERNKEYSRKCRGVAGSSSNIHFVGEVPPSSSKLVELYASSEVFCLVSYSEVEPLTVVEGAISGCKIVCSNTFPLNSSLDSSIRLVNPNSSISIRKGIQESLDSPYSSVVPSFPTWFDVAQELKENYYSAVEWS